jgi:hypothetical protein
MTDMLAEQILVIKNDLSQMYMYPQTEPWVLRNLTLRQFVRSVTLRPPASVADDTFVPRALWKPCLKKKTLDANHRWLDESRASQTLE